MGGGCGYDRCDGTFRCGMQGRWVSCVGGGAGTVWVDLDGVDPYWCSTSPRLNHTSCNVQVNLFWPTGEECVSGHGVSRDGECTSQRRETKQDTH